jgi:hypothetical protein
LNTARSGRRILDGLIVWKKFDRQLTDEEVYKEIVALENEGFEVRKILNSETIIIGVCSDGQNFSKSHLRQVDVHWKRFVETNIQLSVIVSRLDHKKLEEWE